MPPQESSLQTLREASRNERRPCPAGACGKLGRGRTGGDTGLGGNRHLGGGFGRPLRLCEPGSLPDLRLLPGGMPGPKAALHLIHGSHAQRDGTARKRSAGFRQALESGSAVLDGRTMLSCTATDSASGAVFGPARGRARPLRGAVISLVDTHRAEARGGVAAEKRRMAGIRAEGSRCRHLRSGPQDR